LTGPVVVGVVVPVPAPLSTGAGGSSCGGFLEQAESATTAVAIIRDRLSIFIMFLLMLME
jgi:hypothetical protein